MNVRTRIEKIGMNEGSIVKLYWKISAVEGNHEISQSFSVALDETLSENYSIDIDDPITGSGLEQIYLWTIPNLPDIIESVVGELFNYLYNR
jgi:hypothetical protein